MMGEMLQELLRDSLELHVKAHGNAQADSFARIIEERQNAYKNRDFYAEAIEETLDAPVYLWLKLQEQLGEWGESDQWLEQRQLTAGAIEAAIELYTRIIRLRQNAEGDD